MPVRLGIGRMLRSACIATVAAATVGGLASCGTGSTGIGLDLVPQQQVRQAGLDAWQHIRSTVPVSDNAEYRNRAERVAGRVLRGAGEDPKGWDVVVFKSQEVNAFALPGNKIGIYEGMMRMADSDDQLAAVLAHEVAHDEAKHAAQRMSSEAATQAGIDILGSALGTAGGVPPQAIAGLLGAGAQYGIILPYSRNQELEADRLGLRYMAAAGYDPHAAITLWQKMEHAGQSAPTFLSTHPAPAERVEQLEAQLPQAMEIYRGRH
jgi:predicted Zn-dependent protease